MDILVFKILTDVCFYMAMFMPLFLSGPLGAGAAFSGAGILVRLASGLLEKAEHGGAGP